MSKKSSRILGVIMLVITIVFVVFAINHPEMNWSMPLYLQGGKHMFIINGLDTQL